jgi:signal transduction histidine kinase
MGINETDFNTEIGRKKEELLLNKPEALQEIVHDLNNMLGTLSGNIELISTENRMADGTVEDEVLDRRIQAMFQALDRIRELISTLKNANV